MGLKQVVIDAWSWLNYKPVYSDPNHGMPHRRAFPEATLSWVPAADERRLAAYKLLAAYDNNQAAELAQIRDGDSVRDRREFGDVSMFIDTLVSKVLGESQSIVVPGADTPGTDGASPDQAQAQHVQDLLRAWAVEERLPMRMLQCERKAVSLGDGVYRFAWDPAKQRVTLRVTDPGFYFPVIGEDDDAGEFPDRVHFAWELPEDPKRNLKARLRRITFELDWIRPVTAPGVDRAGREVRAPVMSDPGPNGEAPAPLLGMGDMFDADSGTITRQYLWNDRPSAQTCYLTDATWELGDLKNSDVDDLPMEKARFATRSDGEVLDALDLYIDFIPVVHIPNTVPPAEEHWGQPSLAKALQVFDDLQGTDTDSSRASSTTGSPMVALWGKAASGTGKREMSVAPGMVLELGEGGGMSTLNTAPQLQELRNQRHDLADQAANVVRLPPVSLGTMDPSKVPSGYALALTLGPLDSLMSGMRLAREDKEALALKFVQRLNLAGQHPDWAGVTPLPAKLVRGPYTPTDRTAVLEQVTKALTAHAISLETAVGMLREAGFPIDDIKEEIKRIESRSFDDAKLLADATGSSDAVSTYLGIDFEPDPAPPAVVLPGLPGQEEDPQELEEEPAQGSRGNA
ncbi:hypothetical protein HY68_36985 [Streptomyces sp. AcH 505]|uniref:hypothetical protein n=1 Tax=Streptomyces sp. AcH 505 TaxID=352211 RepID=UPI000592220C|nr:hypothetical protein HY68_36985 [Streptomyces sp. AcH 505]